MAAYTLAVNSGSSSLKMKLFQNSSTELPISIATIKVSGLNTDSIRFSFEPKINSEPQSKDISTHDKAFKYSLEQIKSTLQISKLENKDSLAIAHRVVHGGEFEHEAVIDSDTFHELEKLESLAPLHNAPALEIIRTCLDSLPEAKNIAFFDTTFHQSLPDAVKTYAINQKIATEKGLRKYGFHGISYHYILRRVSSFLNKKETDTNLIVMHLGSGASVCAIRDGKSIDTSMGLTPVSGLPGGSRTGDIDPSLVFHYTSSASDLSYSSTKELHITKAEDILNKQSGWKALAGTSDFSKIATPAATNEGKLAFEIFVDRIVGYVGNYYVKLDGKVDAFVFSGGIGESSSYLHSEVLKRLRCLGVGSAEGGQHPDGSEVWEITHTGTKVVVCKTDEEGEMAYQLFRKSKE